MGSGDVREVLGEEGGKTVKERPIIFSAQMVRAILEGRKTQTRRIVKFDIPSWANHVRNLSGAPWNIFQWVEVDKTHHPDGICVNWWPEMRSGCSCPHGMPGDRLWVRETWHTDTQCLKDARAQHEDAMSSSTIFYKADPVNDNAGCIWRSPIFMPRWASRILLEITDIRVERLQEISEGDAIAEGWEPLADGNPGNGGPFDWYRSIWKSINGKDSWNENPWVWCISFKRVDQ